MILGIDIGGSGIKGALVDTDSGALVTERQKLATPQPSTPEAVCATVKDLVTQFAYDGAVGCTFPAIVKDGVTLSAANVDPQWIGTDAAALLSSALGLPVTVVNDGDAAGVAEITHGAAKGHLGVVLMLTFGTGVGSALFSKGVLVPNTEFGHLQFEGHESAEDFVAAKVREDEQLSWEAWGRRVGRYLQHLELLFSPDLFVIGGGVSRKFDRFSEFLAVRAPLLPAQFENQAGIIGAAMLAQQGIR